jgi:hypothetical protein
MKPKLTIVIPTYNRPHLLPRAVRSAVNQSVPVTVIVADDGDDIARTAAILDSEEFADRDIQHYDTGAKTCWANWRAGLEMADTEYAAILQDDDVIRDTYAERIVDVMDYFPDANLWMARLACAYSETLALPSGGCGPLVPLDLLQGRPARWLGGEILAASSYVTAWSLAPALAFRTGPMLDAALKEMPEGADMFIERLLPSAMAVGGPIVIDPIIAGYWIQHGGMLSSAQNRDPAEVSRQFTAHFRCLDTIMDRAAAARPDWAEMLRRWTAWIPGHMSRGWIENIAKLAPEVERGRWLDRVIEVLSVPFDPRTMAVEIPPAQPEANES